MNQPAFQDILDRIKDNDPTLTAYRHTYLLNQVDFSALGVAVGENTHLEELNVDVRSLSGDISTFQCCLMV